MEEKCSLIWAILFHGAFPTRGSFLTASGLSSPAHCRSGHPIIQRRMQGIPSFGEWGRSLWHSWSLRSVEQAVRELSLLQQHASLKKCLCLVLQQQQQRDPWLFLQFLFKAFKQMKVWFCREKIVGLAMVEYLIHSNFQYCIIAPF